MWFNIYAPGFSEKLIGYISRHHYCTQPHAGMQKRRSSSSRSGTAEAIVRTHLANFRRFACAHVALIRMQAILFLSIYSRFSIYQQLSGCRTRVSVLFREVLGFDLAMVNLYRFCLLLSKFIEVFFKETRNGLIHIVLEYVAGIDRWR